jgi:hypothetical protein
VIEYAGQTLEEMPASIMQLVNDRLPLTGLYDFGRQEWPGKNLTNLSFPSKTRQRPVELNTLYWPVGASRWAVAYCVCTDADLQQIRQATYNLAGDSSSQYTAAPFILDNGLGLTVTTNLYMLPPRPLVQCFATNVVNNQPLPDLMEGWWLLTLVDDRYRWWLRGASIETPIGSTQWETLIGMIATALGITITTDPINAAYLDPPVDLTNRYESTPLLLDAVAYSIGQRVVRSLNGAVALQSPSTAKTAWLGQYAALKQMGGNILLDGNATPCDVPGVLPKTVAVSFDITKEVFPNCPPYLSSVDVQGLGLTPQAPCQFIDTKYFSSTAVPGYDTVGTLLNQTQLDALAKQLAMDWVSWQLAPLDVSFIGMLLWNPEGMHDVEWSHDRTACRVERTHWNEWTQEVLHSGQYGSTFYTQISAVIQVKSTTKVGSYYDSFVTGNNGGSFITGQPCWLDDPSGSATLTTNGNYPGCTLIDGFGGRPVYALPRGSGGSGAGDVVLRLTSGTVDATSKMYPGLVQIPIDGTPVVLTDGQQCWAFGPNMGPLIDVPGDSYYVAVFALNHAADNKPVYFVAGTVIDVFCNPTNNQIDFTTA